jgi:hypothetical protein
LGNLGEGGLILALAAIGWVAQQPLIFASLGPTAYELVKQPQLKSARSYNIVLGHFIGLGAGFFAIYVLNAWAAPNVLSAGVVSTQRLWATTIAATLTTFLTLILKASQPAAFQAQEAGILLALRWLLAQEESENQWRRKRIACHAPRFCPG